MIVQPERRIKELLVRMFENLREEPETLSDIFAAEPDAVRSEITEYFSRITIPVEFAFPRKAPEIPSVYLLLGPSSETDKFIGQAVDEQETSLRFLEGHGSIFDMTIRILCVSQSPELVVWLQAVVLWAMLKGRVDLVEQGLERQRLTLSDFRPMQELLPDLVYRRDVALQCKVTHTVTEAILKITDIFVESTVADTPPTLRFSIGDK